ncbi:MAG TPA: DEAD/DEAH box helicase [Balneolaceae bacterium]|nr:DEAD/DEAH box helicase [Balneolaceae bacterium]
MNHLTFSDLGISTEILQSIAEMGFEAPTKIQTATIPPIMAGLDVAGQAQTGTGKTAAFGIPILEKIDPEQKEVQAIVLCPTRELAVQVTKEFIKLATHKKGIFITPVYGGQPIGRQLSALKRGTHIVVGTPGRVIDHLKRGSLSLNYLKMVILDEADEMLNMGFREDLEKILGYSSGKSQTVMFSATMSSAIKKIMQRWMDNPEMIRVEGTSIAAEGIDQFLVEVRDSVRTEAITRILDMQEYRLALIFCNTKRKCDQLVLDMQSRGYSCDALHGDMSQNIRDKVMDKFRSRKIDVLIATDVAARGLDVDEVDIVFNYDIPQDPEYYVHRIGRTGRAGNTGRAYTFSTGRKNKNLRFIEKQIKSTLKTIPMPSAQEVEAKKIDSYLEEIVKTLEAGGLRPYIEQIEPIAQGDYTPIEIAAALLKLKSGRNAAASATREPSEKRESKRPGRSNGSSPQKFRKKKGKGKSKKQEPFYAHFADKNAGKGKKKNRKRR